MQAIQCWGGTAESIRTRAFLPKTLHTHIANPCYYIMKDESGLYCAAKKKDPNFVGSVLVSAFQSRVSGEGWENEPTCCFESHDHIPTANTASNVSWREYISQNVPRDSRQRICGFVCLSSFRLGQSFYLYVLCWRPVCSAAQQTSSHCCHPRH